MKKLLYFGIMILVSAGIVSATIEPKSAYACTTILGANSWDCGVQKPNSEEGIKDAIWTIVANVADMLATFSAYLAAGFIIFGGYKYMFSRGDPGKIADGKKTLFAAFIGIAIAILAKAVVNTILYAILKGSQAMDADAEQVFYNMVDWVIGIAGLVAAIFLVYGGITYITSAGDAGKLTKAKNTIIYALVGMLIVGLAMIINNFVIKTVNNASNSSFLDEKTIAKGVK